MLGINNWGFNARVIFLAMAPVLLVTFVLASYINTARNNDLSQELAVKGQIIANNLASAMEFPVATGNLLQLQGLVEASINKNDLVGVKITDANNTLIYQAGVSAGDKMTQTYHAVILSSAIDYDELFNQDDATTDSYEQVLGIIEVYISTDTYVVRQRKILAATLLITLAGLLMSLFLALLIARGVTRPVREVIETVDQLTRGELSARMTEESGGELGKLRDGINTMAETIQSSQQKLEGQVRETVSDLQQKLKELEAGNIELDIARNEAMQAKDAKSDFLANMSHEIRTPLNAVVGFSRQLEKTGLNHQQQEYTRTINRAARQLLTVINDILNFSKLESETMHIIATEFRLRDCLEESVLMLSQAAAEKGIEMVLLIDADIPDVVVGDQDRLSQVIVNLLNNAIKFTDSGSVVVHVYNELSSENDAIHFSVADTGCGISEASQPLVFSPFYQANQTASKRYAGTGLGLVICKRLIEMMGGEIGFTSTEGEGTEFSFHIPMQTVSHHDGVVLANDVRVLLVDEHDYSRRAIRNALVHMGANTYAVANMDKLMDLLQAETGERANDVVMLSLPAAYPVKNFEADYLQRVRAIYHGTIIVLMSGDYHDIHALLQKDPDIRMLTKPLRSDALVAMLSQPGEDALPAIPKVADHPSAHNDLPCTILVAEDNELNQKYMMGLLSAYHANTVCVDTGIKAVEACKNIHFDLIFMDLHMPGIDGLDAAGQIRALPCDAAQTPIIAVTADVFANEDKRLLEQGFSGCLLKPVDEDKLDAILKHYIRADDHHTPVSEADMKNGLSGLPEDMVERLFTSLYEVYTELAGSITSKDATQAYELAHKILGLVCYFKVGSLADDIRRLQDAVKQKDFASAGDLLLESLQQTQKIEKIWRSG